MRRKSARYGSVRSFKNNIEVASRSRGRQAVAEVVFELLETRQLMTAFAYSGTVQTYTVPQTGVYDLTVAGAQGGTWMELDDPEYNDNVGTFDGGSGAVLSGNVALTAGMKLNVVVGGTGVAGTGNGNDNVPGSGGGGGSFVYITGAAQPLVAAGGGGGGYVNVGVNAQTGNNGATGDGSFPGVGGTGGNAGDGSEGGGGGGWLSGGTGQDGGGPPTFTGGTLSGGSSPSGGFGGGGGGGVGGGGGGGGYSGGGGGGLGDPTMNFAGGGGGGGSYFGPSVTSTSSSVTESGNGSVTIAGVASANPQTIAVAYERAQPITLTGIDAGATTLTYAIAAAPADGKLTGFNPTTGFVSYTPQTGFVGTDSFTFTITGTTTSAPATVTLNVAASSTAPWLSTLSNSTPLSDLSLPGTFQSASGSGLGEALLGTGSDSVVSTGPLAEADEALHITAAILTGSVSSAAAMGVSNPALDAANVAADAAASAADAAEDAGGSSGLGLGLSLASDVTTEISDGYTVGQDTATLLSASDDETITADDLTEKADAVTEETDHYNAVIANGTAAADDGITGTANGLSATTDGASGLLNGTAGGLDGSSGTLDASAIITDGAAEVEGGFDPVADGLAAGDNTAAALDDESSTPADTSADVSDAASDLDDASSITANQTATGANTKAETADENAGELDGATQTVVTNLILALNNAATAHTKSAVSDGLTALYMGAGSASDGYTASGFKTFYTGLNSPSSAGGNSNNIALQTKVYNDAVAEFSAHTSSATLEGAAAVADGIAVGFDTAAAVADSAAVTAVQQEVAANLQAVSANQMAVKYEQMAEQDDELAASDEEMAEADNSTSLADNTTAGADNAAAGIANGIAAGTNIASATADTAADILDGIALATVEIPLVDIGTAAAAGIADGVEAGLDLTSDAADTAAITDDTTTVLIDATAATDDGISGGEDAKTATDAGEASQADEMALTFIAAATEADSTAAAADTAALAACTAADAANSSADTADRAGNVANAAASLAGVAASTTDATFTGDAVGIQTTQNTVQTQTLSIPDQLNAGVRSLDLQGALVNDTIDINSGQYFSGSTLQDTLNQMTTFLQSNPSETIVVTLGNETSGVNSPNGFDADLDKLLTSADIAVPGSTYQNFVYYAPTDASQTPTLGQVRGKIVFVPSSDNTWQPSTDSAESLIGWQPASQVTQNSHTITDPNTRWNYAENDNGVNDNGLIPTDLGSATSLYRNDLNSDNTFGATLTTTSTGATLIESGKSPVQSGDLVDAIADTYFGEVKVSRTTGIVGIDDPSQDLITEIEEENNLPIIVTSDSDAPGATGTLRDAIMEANAQPGFNTIEFAPNLTGTTGNLIVLQSSLPVITNNVDVAGSVNLNQNGFQGFSNAGNHTVSETDLITSDSGPGTLSTFAANPPLSANTSGVSIVTSTVPVVNPVNITYGTHLDSTQLQGAETQVSNGVVTNIPGTFAYTTANGILLHAGGGQLETVTFKPSNPSLSPSTATVVVNVSKVTPQLGNLGAISITYGTALANSQLAGLTKPSGISGAFTYTNAAGSVLYASSSAQPEAVTFTPTDTTDYTSVSSTVNVNVAQATPIVTLVNAVSLAYGTLLDNSQLSGTATFTVNGTAVNVPGTFTYTAANGTMPAGGNHNAAVTFTPSDTTDYKTASSTVLVGVATTQDTPTIVSVSPVNISYGTVLNNSQLAGNVTFVLNGNTIAVPGTFSFNTASGTLLGAGQGQTEAVTFTPTDSTDYTSASSTVIVNVARAVATIQDPVSISYGTALTNSQLQGTATFNVAGNLVTVPGSFAYVNAGAVLQAGNGQIQPIIFTPTDLVDYAPANSTVTVNVAQVTPMLTAVSPLSIEYGTPLANDVPSTSPLFSSNQLNASASFNVAGNAVTVPGLLTYTTAASSVLNPGNGQTEAVTFTPTDSTDFATVFSTVTVNVAQLLPVVTVTDGSPATTTGTQFKPYSSVFTGNPQPATGTVLGASNASIGTPTISYYLATDTKLANPLASAPTNVGNYLVVGTYGAPNSDYIASGDTINFAITPAPTSTTITDAGGTYNGSPFPAGTSKVTGVAGLNTTASSISYSGTGTTVYAATTVAPTNAGTYAVTATYNGDANHAGSSTTVPFTISQAVSKTTVVDSGGTYKGSPFAATSTVTGIAGLNTTASSYLYSGTGATSYSSSTAPNNAGTYSVTATYNGDVNHSTSSAAAAFTIGLAASSTTVVAGGAYTGSPVAATISVTGAGGLNTTPSSVSYVGTGSTVYSASSTAPTNPGTYSVTATYIGDANHSGSTSGSIAFSIGKATGLITLTDAGGVFKASPYPATATVTGVNNTAITTPAATLLYYTGPTASGTGSATAPTNAGTYTAVASFAGNTDYIANSASKTFVISAAPTSITLNSSASGSLYYGQSVTFSTTVSAAIGTPTGSVQFLNGTLSLGTVALVNGAASLTTSSLSIGTDVVTVNYLPSTPNYGGSSTSLTQAVTAGIVLLDSKGIGALNVSGAAEVNATGTSIVVDSTSSQAVQVTGIGVVESNQTDVVGGAFVQPYSGTATNLHTGQASVADPFASLAAPSTTGMVVQSKSTLVIAGISVVTIQPGIYVGGIIINGAAKVTLAPGIYFLEGGGLNIGGSTNVNGKGVLIYNGAVSPANQININGAASVTLSPMTTGTWAGMTIFQARASTAAIVVSGIGTVNVTGTIYAASAAVDILGAGAVDTFGTSLIVDDLNVSGIGELLV